MYRVHVRAEDMKAKQVKIKGKSLKINGNKSNWKRKEDTEKEDKSRRRREENLVPKWSGPDGSDAIASPFDRNSHT